MADVVAITIIGHVLGRPLGIVVVNTDSAVVAMHIATLDQVVKQPSVSVILEKLYVTFEPGVVEYHLARSIDYGEGSCNSHVSENDSCGYIRRDTKNLIP